MTAKAPIQIRPAREGDAPVVISTWVNSYRYGSVDMRQRVLRRVYFEWQRALVIDILTRPTTVALIAHDPEMDTVVYGYLVGEVNRTDRPIIHYVYVKESWQHLGIATALIEATGWDPRRMIYTHYTRDRTDNNPGSPSHGTMRYRGAETLLKKWPAAIEEADPKDPARKNTIVTDGNLYIPFLAYPLSRPK